MATVTADNELAWSREGIASSETPRAAQMNKVFGYLKGLHAAHVMDVGTRLGLLGRLAASSGMAPGTLAAALKLDPDYVRLWCEAACALELLDYNPDAGYRLAPFMDEILGRTQPIIWADFRRSTCWWRATTAGTRSFSGRAARSLTRSTIGPF